MTNQTTDVPAAPAPHTNVPGTIVYGQLAGVVLLWGSNWPLMKIALADIGALSFTATRLAGASLVLIMLTRLLRGPLLPEPGERLGLGVVGLLQIGGFMALGNLGLQFVAPGRAAVLAYTMQMWALPLGVLLTGERPSPRQMFGALLTFAGVVAFFNPTLIDWGDQQALLGNGLVIGCAVSWALGATLYRRRTWRTPFWTQTLWQLAVSLVVIAPLALVMDAGTQVRWTGSLLAILAFNWFIATGLSYYWWSKSLMVMSASKAGQIVCLVPVTALAISAVVTGEPLTLGVLGSVALIGAGILMTVRGR